ncbi:recombinase RecT [Sulfurimonas sp.]|uniref:recombinase RecT n=1 Tax=Sulfurimonas sp. TaxID=2022749 RepID=UPI0025EDA238|nr:recombinase RecT [Sulfurimonas sp.]
MSKRINLQIIEDKRDELSNALSVNNVIVQTLAKEQQEDFKKNFLEFASQDYLLSVVEPKEIIRFAVNITKIGLSIAPSANEVYIIPFDTKVNGTKVMLPQAIIPMNGMQQLAYNSGFMLTVDPVYKFSETEAEAARNLTRIQQSKLNTADPEWIKIHFIGYDVVLKDLIGNLGEQTYFVDVSYVRAATKTNKDEKWSLSTWTHKAVRKAYKQFLVPRDRALEEFEKVEKLNDEEITDTDISSTIKFTDAINNSIKQLGLSVIKKEGNAIVNGTTFGKDKALSDLGFIYGNNKWYMTIEEPHSKNNVNKPSPAKELTLYLINNGLTKEEAGDFVKTELELTSSNINGLIAVLSDKDKLTEQLQNYIEAKKIF